MYTISTDKVSQRILNVPLVPGGNASVEIVVKSSVPVYLARLISYAYRDWIQQYIVIDGIGRYPMWQCNSYLFSGSGDNHPGTLVYLPTENDLRTTGYVLDVKSYNGVVYYKNNGGFWNAAPPNEGGEPTGVNLDFEPDNKTEVPFELSTKGSWSVDTEGFLWYEGRYRYVLPTPFIAFSSIVLPGSAVLIKCE